MAWDWLIYFHDSFTKKNVNATSHVTKKKLQKESTFGTALCVDNMSISWLPVHSSMLTTAGWVWNGHVSWESTDCPVLATSQTQHANYLEYIGRLIWLCPFYSLKIHRHIQVILMYNLTSLAEFVSLIQSTNELNLLFHWQERESLFICVSFFCFYDTGILRRSFVYND